MWSGRLKLCKFSCLPFLFHSVQTWSFKRQYHNKRRYFDQFTESSPTGKKEIETSKIQLFYNLSHVKALGNICFINIIPIFDLELRLSLVYIMWTYAMFSYFGLIPLLSVHERIKILPSSFIMNTNLWHNYQVSLSRDESHHWISILFIFSGPLLLNNTNMHVSVYPTQWLSWSLTSLNAPSNPSIYIRQMWIQTNVSSVWSNFWQPIYKEQAASWCSLKMVLVVTSFILRMM